MGFVLVEALEVEELPPRLCQKKIISVHQLLPLLQIMNILIFMWDWLYRPNRSRKLKLFKHHDIQVHIVMKELTPSPTGVTD
ncbi:hypothetical protein BDFB_011116 [Asbolus verrucosus]|uniref:Uncharacterized protein n=1 Tax=Asbolus verrucosus TaxID=1661398 RepID=A0A482VD41_ASBVE|nr:hypothetical protein BDFB_011116 [Asbolus verrucosus]